MRKTIAAFIVVALMVTVLPARGGEARAITTAPRGVQQFAWSPDGTTIAWSLDGTSIAFARQASPHGGGGGDVIQLISVSDGAIKPMNNLRGTFPLFAPAGGLVAFMGGNSVSVAPVTGGAARNLTQAIDRGMARALWMPDGKALLVGANDTIRVSLWLKRSRAPRASSISAI